MRDRRAQSTFHLPIASLSTSSPKVSLLKQPSDGGYIFGVENGKAKAIEVTVDFSGSVNLKETYPEESNPAAKVSARIEPGATAVLARVAPAGAGQCQIRSGVHVEEIAKTGKAGKFGANPKGASVTKSKPVSESTKEYAAANMQATSKPNGDGWASRRADGIKARL